jgi:hypothetical protein
MAQGLFLILCNIEWNYRSIQPENKCFLNIVPLILTVPLILFWWFGFQVL